MRIVYFISALCLLASCSITTPRDVGRANMFTLSAPETAVSHRHNGKVLKIDYPTAPDELDTYRIAVAKMDGRQDYFAGARWNEFLPSVVQSALIETLSRSELFKHVESDEENIISHYVLHVEVEDCKAVYTTPKGPPAAHITLVFSVASALENRVIAKFRLEHTSQAETNALPEIAKAFNTAFESIATKAVEKLKTLR